MTASDYNWLAAVGYLRKSMKSLARLLRILGSKGANTRVSGVFFEALVQAVPVLGAETWVVTSRTGRGLGWFQHRLARSITGRNPQRLLDGIW